MNESIQYISQFAEKENIDKIAIEQIFEDYRNTDLSYMRRYTSGNLFGGNTSIAINELSISINDIYDLAILELKAL